MDDTSRAVEAEIRKIMGSRRGARSRREAAAIYVKALTEVIADDALAGNEQWQPRLNRYRLAKSIRDDLYEAAEAGRKAAGR